MRYLRFFKDCEQVLDIVDFYCYPYTPSIHVLSVFSFPSNSSIDCRSSVHLHHYSALRLRPGGCDRRQECTLQPLLLPISTCRLTRFASSPIKSFSHCATSTQQAWLRSPLLPSSSSTATSSRATFFSRPQQTLPFCFSLRLTRRSATLASPAATRRS